jgi:hypothetical protein
MAALRAKVHADLQLKAAERKHAEALDLVQALREIRATNHFGESLERAFGGGRT